MLVKTNDSWPSTRAGQFTGSYVQRLICARKMTRVNKHVIQTPPSKTFSQPETVVLKSMVGSITISFLKDSVFLISNINVYI